MAITNYTKTGTKREATVALDKKVFSVELNHELVGLAYRAYLANGRVAGAKTLTRGEVRGGGKKPWRQKGTGRARAGSSRIPHWRGGGVVFGATGEENYTINLPVKAKRAAIRQALTAQAQDGRVAVIESLAFDGKTASAVKLMNKLGLEGRVALVVAAKDELTDRSVRNLPGVELVEAKYLNVYTILNADHLLFTDEALKVTSDWLSSAQSRVASRQSRAEGKPLETSDSKPETGKGGAV